MNQQTQNILRTAEDAVTRLVEECQKQGPLYQHSPKAVAQTSRTGKWLLNAISALHRDLDAQDAEAAEKKS